MRPRGRVLLGLSCAAALLVACGGGGPNEGGNDSPPQIASFSPAAGSVGSEVRIEGLSFASTPSDNQVLFNGALAEVIDAATTALVVKVPVGASTGKIQVTTAGGTAESRDAFTVLPDVPGESFTTRLKAPGQSSSALAFSGNRFVAVGLDGTFASTDARSWTLARDLVHQNDVAWDGNRFVAVGNVGLVEVSSNGLSWERVFATSSGELNAVAGSGSAWVAIGEGGAIASSPDGTQWTSRADASLTTQDLTAVTWSGSRFVAVGRAGAVLTSPDGSSWTAGTAPSLDDLTAVGASPSVIVTAARDAIFTSPDGVAWTPRGKLSFLVNRVLYAGDRFVAVGFYRAATSPDGVTWTESGPLLGILDSLVFTGSEYVALGVNNTSAGTVFTSVNGLDWSTRVVSQELASMARSPEGRLVAVGISAASQTSTDGIHWEFGAPGATVSKNYPFLDVVWSPSVGGFFALVQIAANQYGYKSTDGKTWTEIAYAPCQGRFAASETVMVNVGTSLSGPCIATSPDGVSWTNQTVPEGQSLRHAYWAGDQFVAVGRDGALATSPDGVVWTPRSSGLTSALEGVAASPSMLVAVGENGKIIASADHGVTWQPQSSPPTYALHRVTWTGSEFYAVGSLGTLLRSTDGLQWTKKTTPFTDALNDVQWLPGENRLVLVGEDGLTVTSP